MSLDNFILECEKDNKELEDTIKVLKNKIQRFTRENEELKSQLRGTTHCFDEEEHNKLKEEITNLSKDVDMWNAKYNDMFDENRELKKQLKDKTEDYRRMKDNCDSKVDVLTKIATQQKEFIKYLEDEINKWNYNYDSYNYEYEVEEPTAEELANKILQKYKSIIGDDK